MKFWACKHNVGSIPQPWTENEVQWLFDFAFLRLLNFVFLYIQVRHHADAKFAARIKLCSAHQRSTSICAIQLVFAKYGHGLTQKNCCDKRRITCIENSDVSVGHLECLILAYTILLQRKKINTHLFRTLSRKEWPTCTQFHHARNTHNARRKRETSKHWN